MHDGTNDIPCRSSRAHDQTPRTLHVLVADRFMVKVTAESSDLRTLQNAARIVPMSALAALSR